MTKLMTIVRDFGREEDGIALTEYLILLGLLVGGVIGFVTAFGSEMAAVWEAWGDFFGGLETPT